MGTSFRGSFRIRVAVSGARHFVRDRGRGRGVVVGRGVGARAVAALVLGAAFAVPASAQEQVVIGRDGHGVAHVAGETDAGAFFGAGYAHAEDRLFQMCFLRLIAEGRLAEFLGAGPPGGTDEYIQLDRYHRTIGWPRHAAVEASNLPQAQADLLDAFAAGVNTRMAEVRADPALEHYLFADTGIPLDEDWTAADSLGLWLSFASKFRKIEWDEAANRFEIDAALAAGMTEAEILDERFNGKCDDEAAVIEQGDVDPALLAQMSSYAATMGLSTATNCAGGLVPPPPTFSHAWAVHKDRVVEGGSVLVSDPRLSVSIPNSLYEWHMVGDTFDVRGAGMPGVPYLLVGSSSDVAWGATALGPDQADLFKMDVDLAPSPSTYVLDFEDGQGPQDVPMFERRSEIKVSGGTSQFLTYRETMFGPLVTDYVELAAGQTLAAGEQYALKALPWSHPTLSNLDGFLAMYRATDVASFRAALEGFIFPGVNSVFADSAGDIGYVANGGFGVRAPEFLAGHQALDGTTVANDWQELLPHDFKPWVINPASGVVYSANHQPIGSFYPLPFVSSALGHNTRSWRLEQLLDTGAMLSTTDIYDVHLSAVMPDAEGLTIVAEAIAAIDPSYPTLPAAQAALPHLSAWLAAGAEMTNEHPATFLAGIVSDRFPVDSMGQQNPLAAVYGGRGLIPLLKVLLAKMNDPMGFSPMQDEKDAVEEFIAAAWEKTVAPLSQGGTGSTDPLVWQQVYHSRNLEQVYTLGNGLGNAPWTVGASYPINGVAKNVAVVADTNFPVFVHDQPRATEGGTIMEQAGQSFTQFVIPGIPDANLTVLTPGVREWGAPNPPADISPIASMNGELISENQEPLWSGIGPAGATSDVKFSPTTVNGINVLTGGFISLVTLNYTP